MHLTTNLFIFFSVVLCDVNLKHTQAQSSKCNYMLLQHSCRETGIEVRRKTCGIWCLWLWCFQASSSTLSGHAHNEVDSPTPAEWGDTQPVVSTRSTTQPKASTWCSIAVICQWTTGKYWSTTLECTEAHTPFAELKALLLSLECGLSKRLGHICLSWDNIWKYPQEKLIAAFLILGDREIVTWSNCACLTGWALQSSHHLNCTPFSSPTSWAVFSPLEI